MNPTDGPDGTLIPIRVSGGFHIDLTPIVLAAPLGDSAHPIDANERVDPIRRVEPKEPHLTEPYVEPKPMSHRQAE
jgi:hypothetical protein